MEVSVVWCRNEHRFRDILYYHRGRNRYSTICFIARAVNIPAQTPKVTWQEKLKFNNPPDARGIGWGRGRLQYCLGTRPTEGHSLGNLEALRRARSPNAGMPWFHIKVCARFRESECQWDVIEVCVSSTSYWKLPPGSKRKREQWRWVNIMRGEEATGEGEQKVGGGGEGRLEWATYFWRQQSEMELHCLHHHASDTTNICWQQSECVCVRASVWLVNLYSGFERFHVQSGDLILWTRVEFHVVSGVKGFKLE